MSFGFCFNLSVHQIWAEFNLLLKLKSHENKFSGGFVDVMIYILEFVVIKSANRHEIIISSAMIFDRSQQILQKIFKQMLSLESDTMWIQIYVYSESFFKRSTMETCHWQLIVSPAVTNDLISMSLTIEKQTPLFF